MATIAAETKQDGHRGGEEEEEILEVRRYVLKRGQTTRFLIADHHWAVCQWREGAGRWVAGWVSFSLLQVNEPEIGVLKPSFSSQKTGHCCW